jgi:CTP:phosphocholine cytidylyltransferase-like protein
MNTNKLTVLILAAGYGRRMGPFSRMVNKSLIPYSDKPLISHIIDKFDSNTKFVIACGHLGQQVKDYVSLVHDDKDVVFVDIPDYSESNTGPATTIQHCKEHIQGGFLWVACDTLFEFTWQNKLDHNWIGVYPVDSKLATDYCWVRRDGTQIVEVHNRDFSSSAVDAFIGLMYCKDDEYLNNLIARNAKETPEGFAGLPIEAYTVRTWLDFGTYEKWQELTKDLPENSFTKPNELFYHDNNKVVKYFTDEKHVISRVDRANANQLCMPTGLKSKGNFLVHDWAPGDIVYNQLTPELFRKMLNWCESNIWIPYPDDIDLEACRKFYHTKTIERVNQFRVKYSDWSECCIINRKEVDTIDAYLSRINWDWLVSTTKWTYIHGDLHFDNTIYDPLTDKFTAIDWRTDFAGKMYGDMYYDLAKMLGGIRLNYRSVKNQDLVYVENNDYARLRVPSVENAEHYEELLRSWVVSRGLDWRKVTTLVPIIYLNMAPLHEAPFDKFLIALSQFYFSKNT